MSNPHVWDQCGDARAQEESEYVLKGPLKAWCGESIQSWEWYFLGANHAALSARAGMTTQPCKECVKAIIKELSKALTPSELEEIAWTTEEGEK